MSSHVHGFAIALGSVLLAGSAAAQFGNAWVEFRQESDRVRDSNGAPASHVTSDPQEKDFAWGDLDRDGWTDLVVMRKQPQNSLGAYPNYLLMNEGGLLVDRSAQYASASDVPGDLGFLTPTNDRDAVVVDVDADGWLDLVTCTTLSDGEPKHVSHPRVYVNLQDDADGHWQGLRFEDARFPLLSPTPRFNGVAAGDVTGDGSPDLYFADSGDLDDKLLVNDGNGFFTDSGTSRMSASMLLTLFGTAAHIVDMNGDGANDVVRGQGGNVSIFYNDPNNIGVFNLTQSNVSNSSPYDVGIGDLNRDGRLDVIISSDGQDHYRYNTGLDALGRASWGPQRAYQLLVGHDDGFAGNSLVVDLDGDGWNDTIHCDFDISEAGCNRRSRIYHNPGGLVGSQILLREEAEQPGSGWRGVEGMLASDLKGSFDVAAFDLDNDLDLDLVYGRCEGLFVWMNQKLGCPQGPYGYGVATANSTGEVGHIALSGTTSVSTNDMVLTGTGFPADKTALFLYGTARLWSPTPFGNGNRWIGGTIQRLATMRTDSGGNVSFDADFTTFPLDGLGAGDVRSFQVWYRDPAAGNAMSNASDALEVTVCP